VFIYHFHRIIRHRLVWGVFAIIVSLAFLSVDSCFRSSRNANVVARINRQPVTDQTFDTLEREVRGLGRNRRTNLPFAEAATQVWLQAAALQVAGELKLEATPDEVRLGVQESIGATEGYDSSVHASYLARLKDLNLTPAMYEQYIGRAITLRKLGAVVESAAWVTPVEVDDELAGLTDELTVRIVTVSNRFANIGATEAQIRACFEAHTNRFRLPDRVAVQYVAVAVSNFLPRVSVTEEQIREYYDDHSDKLTSTNLTGVPTLAEARAQIVPLLRRQHAREAAYTNLANAFLSAAIKGGNNGFVAAADAFGLRVQATPLFGLEDATPAGIDAGKDFRAAAFELDPAQPDGRYTVVQGDNFVYAIGYLTNSPAHMPVLEEVVDRVRPVAVAKARTDAFAEYLTSLHKDLAKGLRETRNLTATVQAKSLTASTNITFAVHTLYQNPFDNYMPVARAALHLQPGELSEAGLTPEEDAAVFVYMVARHPGDPLSSEMFRSRARANLERARAMGLTPSWMEWNLARRGLVVTPRIASRLAARNESETAEE
jgi:hypothetical protein